MAGPSSYLKYLPPVLWSSPSDSAPDGQEEFGLASFLLGFEKLLTGLDDDVPIRHGEGVTEHVHQPIATQIAQLSTLFDPWHTPAEFLPWLASWVALEFPTLQDKPLWDEYQQRRATVDVARIHRLRGLKAGLNMSLDMFSVTKTRPRVAIDDGNKLLVAAPLPNRLCDVTALVSQGPVISEPISTGSSVTVNGLVRPRCLAVSDDGSMFVGDFGAPGTVKALPSRVWRLDPSGAPYTVGTPPRPQPLIANTVLKNVVAVAWSPKRAGTAERLFILDWTKSLESVLYGVVAPYKDATGTPLTTLSTVQPVAMTLDHNGDVLILDRGNRTGDPAIPKIVVVQPNSPGAPQTHALTKVIEPLSILASADGSLIVGDGGAQDGRHAGNLVKVTRTNAVSWTEAPLLPSNGVEDAFDSPSADALVSPTALVAASPDTLYVLDAGLRPWATGDTLLTVARPAAVFRVDLSEDSPTVRRVTVNGNLVFPTGMARTEDGRLIICDPGQLESPQQAPVLSRLSPFRFCVAVHFEEASLPVDEVERSRVIGRVNASILGLVDQLRPAHTLATMVIAG